MEKLFQKKYILIIKIMIINLLLIFKEFLKLLEIMKDVKLLDILK